MKYFTDVQTGFYLQHSIELILLDKDGRQLLRSGLIDGRDAIASGLTHSRATREKLIVAYYRYKMRVAPNKFR